MLSAIRHTLRLLNITATLLRYRALFPLEHVQLARPVLWLFALLPPYNKPTSKGQRLAKALEALGPSFIKLGQTLSTRPDIIGEEMAEDLASLQDKVPPFSTAIAIAAIERELEKPLAEIFSAFDEIPVAAASIAQVHQAVTTDGKTVAVKILRPDIEKTFAEDISFFFWLARLQARFLPYFRRLKPVEVVEMFAQTVKLEMDLRFEAAAAAELKENCRNDKGFYVPAIDWQRTSRRVLTLEWVEGIRIHDKEKLLEHGHDPVAIVNKLAVSFFNQAYRDGFFHADMHPGNLFVNARGEIVPVDFGIMGRLNKKDRLCVAQILHGFLERNYRKVAEVHIAAGYVPASTSVDLFAQALRSIGEPIIGLPVNQISVAKLLAQLFKITEDFSMETQPQLLLLQKTMVLVEGIGTTLNSNVNMWQLAEPWIKDWAIANLGPEAKLRDGALDLVAFIRTLPATLVKMEHVIHSVTEEGIRLHPETVRAIVVEREEVATYRWKVWLLAGAVAFITAWLVG